MNKFLSILLGVGKIAEATVVAVNPVAASVDTGIHKIIDSKDGVEREIAIFDTSLVAIENLTPMISDHFTDPIEAHKCIVNIHDNAVKLHGLMK